MYFTIIGKSKQDVPFPVNKITRDTHIEWTLLVHRLSVSPTHTLNYKLDCKKKCEAVGLYSTLYILEASCPPMY